MRASRARIFSTTAGMKAWPPKPGLTDITRTRSSAVEHVLDGALRRVAGLSDTPAFLPSARIACSERCEMRAGFGMHGDDVAAGLGEGFEIGIGRRDHQMAVEHLLRVRPRIALMTAGPKVMLGTKCPSITSRWIQSAPAASTARTSSPSLREVGRRGSRARSGSLCSSVDPRDFVGDGLMRWAGIVECTSGGACRAVLPHCNMSGRSHVGEAMCVVAGRLRMSTQAPYMLTGDPTGRPVDAGIPRAVLRGARSAPVSMRRVPGLEWVCARAKNNKAGVTSK